VFTAQYDLEKNEIQNYLVSERLLKHKCNINEIMSLYPENQETVQNYLVVSKILVDSCSSIHKLP